MSFIDKYYAIFNNSVGQHSVTISRVEFANLLGVFSKQEQQLDQLKAEKEKIEMCLKEQNRLVVGMTKEIETLTFKKYDLLQTLAEIKEITKPYNDMSGNCVIVNFFKDMNEILQKINECEGNDE